MGEVAVTAALPGKALEHLASHHKVRVRPPGPGLAGRELVSFVGGADALICLLADRVAAEVFTLCGRLKIVANYAVGVNNVDLEAARTSGVWITNTPDVLTGATADMTWALILAVARRVVEGDRLVRGGGFTGWRPDLLLGMGLQGKALGIVGMGRIGRAVARRAWAFGMRVCYTSLRVAPPSEAMGADYVADLDDLLPRVDVLSLHCPLSPRTRHLMDDRRMHLLPKGALLINTSRGEVVDENALAAALEDGHLGGAGLDVYENEPEIHPHLLGRDNVALMPHLGSATVEAREAMAELAVENVMAVLAGASPPTPMVKPLVPRR
jgi:glyoxylate reductase